MSRNCLGQVAQQQSKTENAHERGRQRSPLAMRQLCLPYLTSPLLADTRANRVGISFWTERQKEKEKKKRQGHPSWPDACSRSQLTLAVPTNDQPLVLRSLLRTC